MAALESVAVCEARLELVSAPRKGSSAWVGRRLVCCHSAPRPELGSPREEMEVVLPTSATLSQTKCPWGSCELDRSSSQRSSEPSSPGTPVAADRRAVVAAGTPAACAEEEAVATSPAATSPCVSSAEEELAEPSVAAGQAAPAQAPPSVATVQAAPAQAPPHISTGRVRRVRKKLAAVCRGTLSALSEGWSYASSSQAAWAVGLGGMGGELFYFWDGPGGSAHSAGSRPADVKRFHTDVQLC